MSFYGDSYRNLLWPAYEWLRNRHTHILLQEAERRQCWPTDQLREFQWNELQRLLGHAYTQCPWYRIRLDQAGLTPVASSSLENFRHLPLLTKDDIRDHRDEMLATTLRDSTFEHRTGGSTGIPLQFYLHRGTYEWRLAVSMRGYSWAGCEDGDRQFYVWGQPIGAPPWKQRLKTRLFNATLRRHIFSSFRFSAPQMTECVRQINLFRPITIIGYTNALCLLARHILDNNISVVRPQAIITAAEGVNAVQRATIEQAFRAPVFASYGSREFMLIAMECEQHIGLHISADNLLVEVVRPDGSPSPEGEPGEILITDLHNYAMPFIRYKIGDLGVLTTRACPCGRGLPLLERVEGRLLDVIRTADGRTVPGEFFPHLLKEFSAVCQFQVVQKQLDRLQLRLVLQPGDHEDQLRRIQQEIHNVLGPATAVDIERMAEIPTGISGKFRVTISELPPA